MIRETYKGRKIVITRGREHGHADITVNGVNIYPYLGTQGAALACTVRTIDHIGEAVDGNKWGAHWYAPGTYTLCPNDHPRAIGGECTHTFCKR